MVGVIGISTNSFFSKAKKLAVTQKTKSLVEGLKRIAERSTSNKDDEKALSEMRQLLFRNGFSPSDVDLAFMQAQQTKMLNAPPLPIEKSFDAEKLLSDSKPPKQSKGLDIRREFGFGVPMFSLPKQFKENKDSNELEKIALRGLGFGEQKKVPGIKELDFFKHEKNQFSFVHKKKDAQDKKLDKLFKKIMWG